MLYSILQSFCVLIDFIKNVWVIEKKMVISVQPTATVFYYLFEKEKVKAFTGLLAFCREQQNWPPLLPDKGITLQLYQS